MKIDKIFKVIGHVESFLKDISIVTNAVMHWNDSKREYYIIKCRIKEIGFVSSKEIYCSVWPLNNFGKKYGALLEEDLEAQAEDVELLKETFIEPEKSYQLGLREKNKSRLILTKKKIIELFFKLL